MQVRLHYPIVEEILADFKNIIGKDYDGYRNHIYRVLNYCDLLLIDMSDEERKKLQIAAVFHDIALWTHKRPDYIESSIFDCKSYLVRHCLAAWERELSVIIDMHHHLFPYQGEFEDLTELFRKADFVDFTFGKVRYQIPKYFIKRVTEQLPTAGFHRCLFKFTCRQLLLKPWSLIPKFRSKKAG